MTDPEFERFLDLCSEVGVAKDEVRRIALGTVEYLRSPERDPDGEAQALERRWYASLERGEPDYSVYEGASYLGELWACWSVYSKPYLRNIAKVRVKGEPVSLLEDLGAPRVVIDMGCGFGYTTAALKRMFPAAVVYGTNLEGTLQFEIARKLSKLEGFELVSSVSVVKGSAGLVFASEYFEHLLDPVSELWDSIAKLRPKSWLVANSFGTRGLGHFTSYVHEGKWVPADSVSKLFNSTLRRAGYASVKTGLWNNRPNYWRRR